MGEPATASVVAFGGGVWCDGRVAAMVAPSLVKAVNDARRVGAMGVDPDVARFVAALQMQAETWRSSAVGTYGTDSAEPVPLIVADMGELTVQQVAGRLGCSESYARRLARNGSIAARRAGRWLFDASDVTRFADQQRSA